jgi:hypothetical protein
MSMVMETIEVDVPVRIAYSQWAQFESYPQFMSGVERVDQLAVTFNATGPTTTMVTLELDFVPEEPSVSTADALGLIVGRARADLRSFREFVTVRETAPFTWRGGVPGGMIR